MSESFDAKVMSAILSSGETLLSVGNAAAIIGGFGCWYSGRIATLCLLAFSLLCWLIGSYFGVRVAIDRDLFVALAGESPADTLSLDGLLLRLNLIKKITPRSVSDRYSGALRFWRLQRQALTAQLFGLLAAIAYEAARRQ